MYHLLFRNRFNLFYFYAPIRLFECSVVDKSKVSTKKQLTSGQKALRKRYWEFETEWNRKVDLGSLSEEEKLINRIHNEAVINGHFTYDDPATGNRVMTRLRHFLKGTCCGNACRHCVYNHEAVPKSMQKTMRFNSAFWVPVQSEEAESNEED
ncbi:hypothetical protein QYM36_002008 [Artemia franciscana]|uniref:Uncharacterized protein n=1 Tax=Artemia franciscana TaxID=6661 RepID=A0AA88LIY8_ARTSF|nr:hypothetical protein QYM36_002008 [Artemia franciscana]KAK2723525.1 hypothetical protein QYM36_002008 [Artemia franciscana]